MSWLTSEGKKFDAGKAPLSLVDRFAIEQIGQVLAFGANKYGAHNWRGGINYSRLLDAALRHLYAFADGEDNDPESGLSHIAHAGCNIVFLLGMIRARGDLDDRCKFTGAATRTGNTKQDTERDMERDMGAKRYIVVRDDYREGMFYAFDDLMKVVLDGGTEPAMQEFVDSKNRSKAPIIEQSDELEL